MSGNRNLPAGGLPPADLGAAFDVPGERRGRLGAILQPATPEAGPVRTTVKPVEPTPELEQDKDQGVVDDQAPPAADTDDQTTTKQLIVYMPAGLRARLRRAAVGSTQLDVMLDAVEKAESSGELGRLVAQYQAPATDGLFTRRAARGSEANVQVNVRAMRQHTAVLDRLAARYGTNRSELIRVALDHLLAGGARRRK